MQTHLFPFLISIVFLILHFVVYRGLFYQLSHSKIVKNCLKFLMIINFIGSVCYLFLKQYSSLPQWIYFLLSLSIGIIFSLFIATVVYQFLAFFIRFIIRKNRQIIYTRYLQELFILLSIFYIGYGIYNAQSILILKKISIYVANLTFPLKIVQLSDIHIGGLIQKDYVKKIVQITNEQNPDIIVLTGDIIDTKSSNVIQTVEELKNLKSSYGVYYVLGNHEYFYDIDNIVQKMENLGFHVLINQNITITQENKPLINIAGITDFMGNRLGYLRPNLQEALLNQNSHVPTILLSHQPKIIHQTQDKAIDIILSGHTHGGQIFPFGLAVLLQQPYLMGLHKLSSHQVLYVNQGTGFWGPPMRIGTHSEITLITLLPK
ncbi:hypothetical protein BKH45_07440 [Helicobacter sp. 11S03491-1]|nr:hypothetical protein BKH45_07440 [Helicobacter sp. 11S03491-1]